MDADKWELGDALSRIDQMSDWARTQLGSADTYIGRARRETFDRRLKFKREIECDVRDYLGNIFTLFRKLFGLFSKLSFGCFHHSNVLQT